MAIAVITLFSIRLIISGERPTLTEWAPIPKITGLPFFLAFVTDLTIALKSYNFV